MNHTLRNMSLAFAVMLCASPMLGSPVQAKPSFMEVCSAKYKAAKAAGTLEAGTKWTDFMKTQCAADATATDAAATDAAVTDATAATPAVAAKPAKIKKVKAVETAPADAMAATATPSGSFMQNCSAAWKDMKAKNTVPDGLKWKDFVAAKCVVTPAKATAADAMVKKSNSFMSDCSTAWQTMKDAGTVPAGMAWKDFVASKCVVEAMAAPKKKPTAAKKAKAMVEEASMQDETPAEPSVAIDGTPLKTVDKNGKAFTPGQMAAHARARACGARWRGEKLAGTLPAGAKWPQYWSSCNTQMKAEAQ
jgi:hypothetical protein